MTRRKPAVIAAAVIASVLVLLSGLCLANPAANVPVVAPLVCAVRGGAWYGGSWIAPAGCYARP